MTQTSITPSKNILFNGTNRAFVIISIALTILSIAVISLVGPEHFKIDAIGFKLCDTSNGQRCSRHLTPYALVFGLMITYLVSSIILFLFNTKQQQIDQSLLFRAAQTIIYAISSVSITYLGEKMYKIGYWMFVNSLLSFFIQAQYSLSQFRKLHYYCIRTEKNRILLGLTTIFVVTFVALLSINALFFFGEKCQNHYDILFVCTVTLNILGLLVSIFDKIHGFFFPLSIAALTQLLLFSSLHLTPKALKCSNSPFRGFVLEWVLTVLTFILYTPMIFTLLIHFTTPTYHYLQTQAKLFVSNGYNEILLPVYDNSQYSTDETANVNNTTITRQPESPKQHQYDDHTLLVHDWTLQSTLSQFGNFTVNDDNKNENSSSSGNIDTNNNLDITSLTVNTNNTPPTKLDIDADSQEFIQKYFYSSDTRPSPAISVYLFAMIIMSVFTFAITHFGEHNSYQNLGIMSNNIQWFFVMFGGWLYIIYAYYLLARNLFPNKNLI